jgi:hypothetical protein
VFETHNPPFYSSKNRCVFAITFQIAGSVLGGRWGFRASPWLKLVPLVGFGRLEQHFRDCI